MTINPYEQITQNIDRYLISYISLTGLMRILLWTEQRQFLNLEPVPSTRQKPFLVKWWQSRHSIRKKCLTKKPKCLNCTRYNCYNSKLRQWHNITKTDISFTILRTHFRYSFSAQFRKVALEWSVPYFLKIKAVNAGALVVLQHFLLVTERTTSMQSSLVIRQKKSNFLLSCEIFRLAHVVKIFVSQNLKVACIRIHLDITKMNGMTRLRNSYVYYFMLICGLITSTRLPFTIVGNFQMHELQGWGHLFFYPNP